MGTSIDDFAGLNRRRPALALGFTVLLLAQAGVPFTTGFFAKFGVVGAAVDAHSYWLAIIAMATAVVTAFVYLRVVVAMFLTDGDEDKPKEALPFSAALGIGLAVLITVAAGIQPSLITDWAEQAVPVLVAVGR
jgi:NADH-quinone oxidoreductase subunit N